MNGFLSASARSVGKPVETIKKAGGAAAPRRFVKPFGHFQRRGRSQDGLLRVFSCLPVARAVPTDADRPNGPDWFLLERPADFPEGISFLLPHLCYNQIWTPHDECSIGASHAIVSSYFFLICRNDSSGGG